MWVYLPPLGVNTLKPPAEGKFQQMAGESLLGSYIATHVNMLHPKTSTYLLRFLGMFFGIQSCLDDMGTPCVSNVGFPPVSMPGSTLVHAQEQGSTKGHGPQPKNSGSVHISESDGIGISTCSFVDVYMVKK